MLTDMAPSATGQFYGSQMGITNIAPHIQKTVSKCEIVTDLIIEGSKCFFDNFIKLLLISSN